MHNIQGRTLIANYPQYILTKKYKKTNYGSIFLDTSNGIITIIYHIIKRQCWSKYIFEKRACLIEVLAN